MKHNLSRVLRIQFYSALPKSIFAQKESSYSPSIFLGKTPRLPVRHCGANICLEGRSICKLFNCAFTDQCRHVTRKLEPTLIRTFSMAAALPTISIFGGISLPKFFGQSLPLIPMAWQTRKPVNLSTKISLGRDGGQCRLSQAIRCWGSTSLSNYIPKAKRPCKKQGHEQK